jgi:hypothetical protein
MLIETRSGSDGLRVVFQVRHPVRMLIEMTIDPCAVEDASARRSLARIEKIIANSRYGFADCCGCEECEWHAVMAIIRHCLKEAEIAGCRAATRALTEEHGTDDGENDFKPVREARRAISNFL